MMSTEQIEVSRTNWLRASQDLNFSIITPFFIETNSKNSEVFAFLPEYGAFNGTLVYLTSAPLFETNPEIIKWAKDNDFYLSILNIEDFQKYDETYFEEILKDWTRIQKK